MRSLFINLIAVNIFEISDKTSSATFTKFCSSSEFTNKRKIYCSASICQIEEKKVFVFFKIIIMCKSMKLSLAKPQKCCSFFNSL